MTNPFPIPLNALRAIEIVARRGALAPAAEELGVTVGAVSQHIRRAEARLGVDLFERTPAGLVPLPALAQVLPQLTGGFAGLADALSALAAGEEGVLTLTVGAVFASRWLIWRIGKFNRLHPEIELRLVVTGHVLDLNRADIDCAIRYGVGGWPGVRAQRVGGFTYRPVCAPPLAERLRSPADIAHIPVIRDEAAMVSWAQWWATAGIAHPPEVHGPAYTDPSLAFDAAISGQGVLLAVDMMAADAISDGRLAAPFDLAVESPLGYWLAVAESRRDSRKVKALRDWLAAEVPASARGYVHQQQMGEWV
ncbi:LysR substrate-binding domain-containing protein [Devosia nitrariae]|uniref:LysR family transcriptional regulator n=1 Tax=Devosia nitrariae TaxID=2071872 RepID=A0ABQ5W0H3_9HYPH|nr:LysR substrate-binding domain-containing protein [Devosia nitrariae]GLQ53391.1 LysR family transcriptional regulator [Devosia nitrariae]